MHRLPRQNCPTDLRFVGKFVLSERSEFTNFPLSKLQQRAAAILFGSPFFWLLFFFLFSFYLHNNLVFSALPERYFLNMNHH